jgi:hypothetical protein
MTRSAPYPPDKIGGSLRWMGAFIVEVTSLRVKPGYDGRKSSVPSSNGKRKRGGRGTRKGKARGRQPRCPNLSGSAPRKGTPSASAGRNRRYRKELRFKAYIFKNFERLDNIRKTGGKQPVKVTWGGGERILWKTIWSVRLKSWKQRFKRNRNPLVSAPFGLSDLDASFKKFLALKHGTWENVLSLPGISPTGEYNEVGEPTSFERDRRMARQYAPAYGDSPLRGCTHSSMHIYCSECGGCCMRGSAPQCCNRHLDRSGRRLPSGDQSLRRRGARVNRRGERKHPSGTSASSLTERK